MVFRSLKMFQSGLQSERCGSKSGTCRKSFGSTTPLANPSQEHPHGGTFSSQRKSFQQKHLPPGGRNLEYLGSVGRSWWDKVAPLPQGRVRAAGCGIGQPGILWDKGGFEMGTKGKRHMIQSSF